MKRLLCYVVTLLFVFSANAQADVTKFLGVPVDGSKEEMIAKLEDKGFRMVEYDSNNNAVLEGEFNGVNVYVVIVTNKNKVYRIMVVDKVQQNGNSIKRRFNTLCEQFKNHPNYFPLDKDYKIPENEDIEREILINKKNYQAIFYQRIDTKSDWYSQELKNFVNSLYTQEQREEINTEEQKDLITASIYFLTQKTVWFQISEFGGKYLIVMFYDNKYNKANGEDL